MAMAQIAGIGFPVMFFLLDQKEPKSQGLSPSTTHFDRIPLHKINSPGLSRFIMVRIADIGSCQ
jgi:hypothetical protein